VAGQGSTVGGPVTRLGTQMRTDLTAAEYRRVKAAAKRERISASQWIGRAVRERLAADRGGEGGRSA
jgi:hypothetical protein